MNPWIKFLFRWYDLYVGFYYDRFKKHLYIVFLGLVLRIRVKEQYSNQDREDYKHHMQSEMIENIADKLGIYEGKYNNGERDMFDREINRHKADCNCRMCFYLEMKDLIEKYV